MGGKKKHNLSTAAPAGSRCSGSYFIYSKRNDCRRSTQGNRWRAVKPLCYSGLWQDAEYGPERNVEFVSRSNWTAFLQGMELRQRRNYCIRGIYFVPLIIFVATEAIEIITPPPRRPVKLMISVPPSSRHVELFRFVAWTAVGYDVEAQFCDRSKHSHRAIQSQNNIDWKLFFGFPQPLRKCLVYI